MTDKELLELAAKAVGRKWLHYAKGSGKGLCCRDDSYGGLIEYYWNPLTDDGDALRLSVSLRIEVAFSTDTDGEEMVVAQYGKWAWRGVSMEQDQYAATRRAIVRAAAEIGKTL